MRLLADRPRDVLAIGATLSVGGLLLLYVLGHVASADVVKAPKYILMYLVLGLAWVRLVSLGFPFAGLSARDDIFERRNAAAVPAVVGAIAGVMLCYAGANIGNGPGWWVVLFSAALATALLMVAWLALATLSDVADAVTIDRDPSAGLRLGAFLGSCGLVCGRAVAGDWHSPGETIADALAMIPAAFAILAVSTVVERIARPTPIRPRPPLLAFGVVPAIIYVAIAVAGATIAGWPI
jgi:hypothetical protein